MGHGHAHRHAHGSPGSRGAGRLALVLALSLAFMVAEVVGGLAANSLALLADAGHMLSDVAALALSLAAIWIARRPAGPQSTYGFHRTEILAALANGATLVAIATWVLIEAWQRWRDPAPVEGPLVLAVAAGGLVVNLVGLALLHRSRHETLNLRGAWLHLLTDALGSVQALVAGGLVWAFGWHRADPVASALIALLVVWSSWHLLRETVGVLMESAPGHIDVEEVRGSLLDLPGVVAVHDLHVWTIASGRESLSAHVVAAEGHGRDLLTVVRACLHDRFGLHHVTIQVEPEAGHPERGCGSCD